MAEGKGQISLFDKPVTYEYEVFLGLSKKIEDDAVQQKKIIEALVGPDKQKYFRPHISFLSFKQKADSELVLGTLQNALAHSGAVDVEIKGYKVFSKGPRGQAIILNVVASDELKNLYAVIQSAFRCGKMKGLHLTIVRTVYLSQIEDVQGQLDHLSYAGTFRCTQFILLRRPKDTKEKYEEAGILHLGV
jgi:2'-5' RNA ligase